MVPEETNAAVLYISYEGMLEPLGQSQVLGYMEHLAKDRNIYLISFEKPGDWANPDEVQAVRERIQVAGIHWYPRRYHKLPSALATAWDIAIGSALSLLLVLRHRIKIVHARSYVAGVMAWLVSRTTSAKFLFDMRGFWADERVDGGLWPREGRMYRVAKWFERQFLLDADHVVSLTNAALQEIRGFDYLKGRALAVSVIPTCANLARFKPPAVRGDDDFVLGYVGSAGTWYLFDSVVESFRLLRAMRPSARLLVINRNAQQYIRDRLEAGGIPESAAEVRAVPHNEVPGQMARMSAGIFFYKPSYSRAACSPTKLGEFLGCGIPCLANTGVGDMARILEAERVGFAVDSFDSATLAKGLGRLLELVEEPGIRQRCVAAAQRHFSLEQGVMRYDAIYRSMTAAGSA